MLKSHLQPGFLCSASNSETQLIPGLEAFGTSNKYTQTHTFPC